MSEPHILKFNLLDSEWIVTKIKNQEFDIEETWTVEVRPARQKELQSIGTIELANGAYWASSRLLGINSVSRQTIRRCVQCLHYEWWHQSPHCP
jgi:hypothetical protein